MLMPEATHFIHYHFVAEGACLIRTEDGRAEAALSAGDVVVFRGDQRHSYHNPGRAPAIGYSVVVLARAD